MPADEQRRFGGLARLYGLSGAKAISQAHVAVIGIGGVGSWAAEALARSGVARLTLIDMDHVSESNINRQIHASDATLGMAKVQAMGERIHSFHPTCDVRGIDDFVTAENWPAILPAGVDAVIDACDQVAAKTGIGAWARTSPQRYRPAGRRRGAAAAAARADRTAAASGGPSVAEAIKEAKEKEEAELKAGTQPEKAPTATEAAAASPAGEAAATTAAAEVPGSGEKEAQEKREEPAASPAGISGAGEAVAPPPAAAAAAAAGQAEEAKGEEVEEAAPGSAGKK